MADTFKLAEYVVEPAHGQIIDAQGNARHLTPRAMQLLVTLAARPGEVLSRERLIELTWADQPVQPQSIGSAVSEIRRCLGDDPRQPKFIETLPTQGYRLLVEPAPVATVQISFWQALQERKVVRAATLYAISAFVLLQIVDATSGAVTVPVDIQRLLLACLIGGFPVILLLAWYFERFRGGIKFDTRELAMRSNRHVERIMLILVALVCALIVLQIMSQSAPGSGPIRIAVLPFNNFTGDPANEYLSDGLAEELLDGLQQYEDLSVLAHSATYHFKNKDVGFETIASTLNVDAIVEGSLLDRDGNRIRVVAQLVDGTTGTHRWSNVYDRELQDFLSLKKDIVRQMAGVLNVERSDSPQPDAVVGPDTQIYDLYLQGKDRLRRQVSRQDQEMAEQLFQQVLAVDESFRPALNGLCQVRLEKYVLSRNVEDFRSGADTCSLLVDDRSASVDALVALGTLNRVGNKIDDAIRFYERAVAVAPAHEPAFHGLSRCYEAKGEFVTAENYAKLGIDADSTYWKAFSGYAGFLFRQGRYEESAKQSIRVTELAPEIPVGWTNLGVALFAGDQWEEAELAWRRAFELKPTRHGFANLGTLMYYQHRFDDARRMLEAGVEAYPQDHRLLAKLGAVYRLFQDTETQARSLYRRAFDATRRALDVNPDDAILLGHHAYYAAAINEADDARRAIAKAGQLQPNNPEVAYLNAYVAYLLDPAADWSKHVNEALEMGYSVRQAAEDPMLGELAKSQRT